MSDQQVPMREFLEQRMTHQDRALAVLESTLKAVLEQTTITNGRLRTAEQDIAVLKDRANPWAAGGVGAGAVAALAAIAEWLRP